MGIVEELEPGWRTLRWQTLPSRYARVAHRRSQGLSAKSALGDEGEAREWLPHTLMRIPAREWQQRMRQVLSKHVLKVQQLRKQDLQPEIALRTG